MGTNTDGFSPLYDRGPHGALTLDGAAGISGEPRSVVARDCADGSCGRLRRGRPTTHWGRLRSPDELDGQWTEWCDRHGLLGEYADAAIVGGKMIFGPEGAEMSRAVSRPGWIRAETESAMATAVSGRHGCGMRFEHRGSEPAPARMPYGATCPPCLRRGHHFVPPASMGVAA